MGLRALLSLLLWATLACAPDPGAARQRLWDQPATLLPSGPRAKEVERTLLDANFARQVGDWMPVSDPRTMDLDEPVAFRTSTGIEEGRDFVTLEGSRGGLYTVVPVEPRTYYEFEGEVRIRDLQLGTEAFVGATFFLGEVSAVRPQQHMAQWKNAGMYARHPLASAKGTSGWQPRKLRFRTGTFTRGVYVACVLSYGEELRSGTVDFSGVRLRRLTSELGWKDLLRTELESRTRVTSDTPWHEERRVRARLGNEDRTSIVLLPGERIRLTVRLPPGAARFRCSVGPWLPALVEGVGGELAFSLRANGRELREVRVPIAQKPNLADWAPLEADLGAGAGDETEIELGLEGDLPGVFGAPIVAAPETTRFGPNLILISIDTLRADHVGAYGSTTGTTPCLDRLAREGILCRDASSQSSWTLPSHATIFSGQFPALHGAQRTVHAFSDRSPSLAEILADWGYATQGFTAGGYLESVFGFSRGFDGYADLDPLRDPESDHFRQLGEWYGAENLAQRQDRYGFEAIGRWLEAHRDTSFFLFLHTYAVHDYDVPEQKLTCRARGCTSQAVRFAASGLSRDPADQEHLVHRYDAALAYVDGRIDALLRRLDELGLREDTIVVVTSDHGEDLLERRSFSHGNTLYQVAVHVPLILSVPRLAPRVVEDPVMLVDVAPTCLALLDLPPDPRMQGRNLLVPGVPRPTWGELDPGHPIDVPHRIALRDEEGWKLIRTFPLQNGGSGLMKEELFLLHEDPKEIMNLAAREPARVEELARRLAEELDECARRGVGLETRETGELDRATLERLRALGYAR
jgi:arylsulfatase A-like enzyme